MKTLRLRKLLSGLLCAALVAGTVLGMGSRRVQAGLVANVVTGKWGAIAVSTLERSILFGLSKVESNTDSDTIADIMMWTKRIIAGNSANIAKQTLQTVKEIQAQLQSLYNYERQSNNQMEDMLNKILSNEAKNNFVNGTYEDIRNFSNNYNQVLARYDALINSYIAYGEDPNETTKSALTVAYNDIYTAYYQSGTEKVLFTDPLYGTSSYTGFLPSISPYNSAQAINNTEDITDSSRWQRSDSIISGTTYLEQYMSCLSTFTAFESNQYEAMKGAANFAAVSAYNYLQAYRYYAELSSVIISSDSSSSARKKDEDISGIWKRYNDAALKIQRGLNQMLSLYTDVFDHYMLPYDTENTVELKDYKASENEYDAYTGYCKANGYNGINPDTDEEGVYKNYTISNQIITEKQKLYQFKIAGDNKAYAIRESGGTNTPLLNQHTYAQRDHVMFTTTTISYDLLSLLKGTANGYQVITSPADLSAITNPGSNPAYTQSDILTNYLQKELHNLVSDLNLPSVQARAESTSGDDIRGGKNFLLLRNMLYFDFDNSIDLVGEYKDMVAVWANASMPGMGIASMDLEDDIADNCGSDKPLYNQEMVVMFAGNPTSGISLEQNEGGIAVVEGPDKTLTSSGSMTVSGGSTLNVTVTPDAGKTVESVQLLDGNGTLLRQFAGDIFSTADNSLLYTAQEYFDMISGEDGTLCFSLSAPYIDAKIRVAFKDIDPTLVKHKVTLLDTYDGENKAVVLQFGSYDYLSEKDYKQGEEVTVSVTGYSNYMPKGIKVTDSAGNTADVEVTDITDDSSRMMPSERIYRFKMPDYDLKISAETEAAFEVSVADSNTKHTFRDLNCYDLSGGKTWEDADAVTYAAGDTVHLSIEPDQGYVLDRVEVTAGRNTVPAVVKDDGITFTMPAENVSVKPVTSREDVYNSYLAQIGKDADGAMLQFCMDNSEHTMLNVKSMQVKPGEKVLFTFVKTSDLYNASFTVTDSKGKNIDYKAESAEDLYSFEMPESDVLLSVISTSRVKAVIQNTYLEDTEFAFVKSDGSHSADYQTYNVGETITVYTNNRSAFEHGVTVSDQDGTDITKTLAFSTDADAQTISFSAPDTKEITIIPVDIHHYENGICTVCGHFETPAARSDGYLEIKNAGNFFWYAAVVNQDHTHADFEDVIEGDTYMGACTNAVLLNDIDLENIPFESIGYRHDYKGVFDGDGYTIRNFSADGSLGTCAMFGNMGGADAAVKNVTVQGKIDVSQNESLSENVTDWRQDVYLGLILMTDNEEDPLTVSHVVNDVDIVTGTKDISVISGLVSGRTYSGKVTADHCTNYGTISCDSKRISYVAGLFSNVSVNSASDCVNYGDMELKSSEQYVHYYGGIANLTGGIFERCVNFGNLHIEAMSDRYNSSSSAAGIVASYEGFAQLLLKDCANVGEITGTNGLAGGLAGNILGETILENCYNYGDLESLYSDHVGALITKCNSDVRFENCYALDVIEGKTTFGDQITYASASQFLSGETGYKLNGGVTDGTQAWHQDIDNDAASKNGPDAYPLPFSTKGTIYEISAEEEYSNYEGDRPETVTYTIETETTGYGSIILTKPDTGDIAVSAQEGETIHAEIIPFEGYILESSTINGKDTGTDYGTFTDSFVMPGENIVVSVVFENTVLSHDIYTYEDLVNAANNVRSDPEHYAGATFRLMNDIDGNGADWTIPIGTAEVPFNGTFEGNDYIIQNLTIHEYAAQTNTILDSEEVEKGAADLSDGEEKTEKGTDILSNEGENAEEVKELLEGTSGEAEGSETETSGISGLFGVIGEQGCVRHLATLAFNWAEDAGYAGGIAAINRGTIDYCSSGINIGSTGDESGYIDSDVFFADLQSSIRGSEAAGGISALNEGLISNTRNNSLVLDAAVSGGIVAVNKGTIINFYNLGHVFGTAAEGGVAGQNEGSISIGYTAFAMEVSGSEQSGQVVGSTTNTGFTDLYYSTEGNISGDGQDNGAFAGTVQKPDKEIKSEAFADTLNTAAEGQGLGEWIYESSKNLGYPRIKAAVLVTKTLTGKYGITLTGQVHPDAKLETVELDGTSEDYQAMEASLTGSTMLAAYDISLRFANERRANMEGDLIISIPVEKAKKLEDLTVMHRHFGELFDVKADKLENGAVQITVGRLSAFGIAQADSPEPTVIPTVTPEPTVTPTPTGTPVPTAAPGSGGNSRTDSVKTGDPNNTALPVILLICAGIALLTLFAVRRRTGGKDTES